MKYYNVRVYSSLMLQVESNFDDLAEALKLIESAALNNNDTELNVYYR